MKQSKHVQYLLLLLVVGIWGAIMYQVWQYLKPEQEEELYVDQNYTPQSTQVLEDSFVLLLDYPDPFTGKITVGSGARIAQNNRGVAQDYSSHNKRNEEQDLVGDEPIATVLPDVEYVGYSVSDDQVTRVRLKVDGTSMTYQLNKEKADLLVTKMSRDSVVVHSNGEQVIFYRKP